MPIDINYHIQDNQRNIVEKRQKTQTLLGNASFLLIPLSESFRSFIHFFICLLNKHLQRANYTLYWEIKGKIGHVFTYEELSDLLREDYTPLFSRRDCI